MYLEPEMSLRNKFKTGIAALICTIATFRLTVLLFALQGPAA